MDVSYIIKQGDGFFPPPPCFSPKKCRVTLEFFQRKRSYHLSKENEKKRYTYPLKFPMQNVALPFECAFPSLWYQGQKRQNDVVTSVGLLPRFSYIGFFFPHHSFASIHLRPIPSFACGFRALLFCLRPSCASLLPVAFACIHSSASFIYRLFLSHHGFFFPMHLPLLRFLLA